MFIFTAKMSKRRIAAIILTLGAAAVIGIALLISAGKKVETAGSEGGEGLPVINNIKTNDDRIAFLVSFGWEVSSEPLEFEEVRIPSEFDDVYKRYNDIQKEQGFDLSKYKGKRVMRYTYLIKNYPDDAAGEVRANMLIFKNRIIGGDVCSVRIDGFMHTFNKPKATGIPSPTSKPTPTVRPTAASSAIS